MATTIATVTKEGLALSPEIMADLGLKPGTQITVVIGDKPREAPADIQRLIRETRGMFAGGRSMADELIEDRREDDRRFNKTW
jgi:hypothetical protein